MEVKKSPKADLENKKSLFLEIGLFVVMVIVLVAFEWGTRDIDVQKLSFEGDIVTEEEIINTEQEQQKPPEQPPVVTDVLVIVDDKIQLTTDMDLFDTDVDEKSAFEIMAFSHTHEEAGDEDIPFISVEEPAGFRYKGKNGVDAFRMWIADHMKYPEVAVDNGIQGRVTMAFVVAADGRVVNVKVLRGVDPVLDKEAIRVIESSPKWTPGKQRNKPVRILYTLQVIFNLQ